MIHSRTSHAKFRRSRFNIFKYDPSATVSPSKTTWKHDLAGFAVLAVLGVVFISLWRAYSGGVEHIALLDWPVKILHAVFASK